MAKETREISEGFVKHLNEGMVNKFVRSIINAYAEGKRRAVDRALENDPEYQKAMREFEKGVFHIKAYADHKRKTDPNWETVYKKIRGIYGH